MTLGKRNELSKELEEHALFIESEGMSSGNLIEMARFLAEEKIGTMEEFKDRVRK